MDEILHRANFLIVKTPDSIILYKLESYETAARIGAEMIINSVNGYEDKEKDLVKLYLEKKSWRLLLKLLEMFDVIQEGCFEKE